MDLGSLVHDHDYGLITSGRTDFEKSGGDPSDQLTSQQTEYAPPSTPEDKKIQIS